MLIQKWFVFSYIHPKFTLAVEYGIELCYLDPWFRCANIFREPQHHQPTRHGFCTALLHLQQCGSSKRGAFNQTDDRTMRTRTKKLPLRYAYSARRQHIECVQKLCNIDDCIYVLVDYIRLKIWARKPIDPHELCPNVSFIRQMDLIWS